VKVLLTGASSFTGAWFAAKLAQNGHQVLATLRSSYGSYEGLRKDRLDWISELGVQFLEGMRFGDDSFIAAINGVDLIAHHAAEVTNYHSADFDVIAAVDANTANVRIVTERAAAAGLRGLVVTGSVFEQDEGLGEAPLKAFSPYGLSKGLSWQVARYWADRAGLSVGKFVIPNPFGPFEEARFCAYLLRTWVAGERARVRTPSYVRDNIPIDLLSMRYVRYLEQISEGSGEGRCAPSGYVESQGRFALRFAEEIGSRLGIDAPLDLAQQTEFAEPVMRTNSDFDRTGWDEAAFWDAAAEYYRKMYCR
jgi:UDP-glucose 4-epimerase